MAVRIMSDYLFVIFATKGIDIIKTSLSCIMLLLFLQVLILFGVNGNLTAGNMYGKLNLSVAYRCTTKYLPYQSQPLEY